MKKRHILEKVVVCQHVFGIIFIPVPILDKCKSFDILAYRPTNVET